MSVTNIVLTDPVITALQFIERYRYLTVKQVATITGLKVKSTSEMLLRMQRQKLLSFFGNVPIRGYGKTPKVYFLTKRGYSLLEDETGDDTLAVFRPINRTSRWTPSMYHRIATLDVMMALEQEVTTLPSYRLDTTLLEYRRIKYGGGTMGETTDYVALPQSSETKIVPDAGFVLENTVTGAKALFLVEVDLGTMTHQSSVADAVSKSFCYKIQKYDRYLKSGRFRERYKAHGQFSHFTVLVVTTTDNRVENMRTALQHHPEQLHQYYRFSTIEAVCSTFFHSYWRGRGLGDHTPHSLIRDPGGRYENRHQAR